MSGKDKDKVKDCNFEVFYGKLKTAPMIEQFAVNFECTLLHILGTPSHATVIGQVVGTYISENYIKNGKLDAEKFNPLLWYPGMGQYVANCQAVGKIHSIGNSLNK